MSMNQSTAHVLDFVIRGSSLRLKGSGQATLPATSPWPGKWLRYPSWEVAEAPFLTEHGEYERQCRCCLADVHAKAWPATVARQSSVGTQSHV